MKKKRLLFRIERLRGGGAEKSLIILLRHLDYSKYEVDLLLDHKNGVYLNQIPKQVGLFFIVEGKEFFSKNLAIRGLQKIWRELRWGFYRLFPRFVYRLRLGDKRYEAEIGFLESILPFMSRKYLAPKEIGWIHSDLTGGVYEKKEVDQMIASAQKIDALITVSRQAKDSLLSLAADLKRKIQVVYNPIDVEEVIDRAHQEQIKLGDQKISLLSIGRLSKLKGFDRLINTCHKLKNEGIDFKLFILGEGPYRDTLAAQIVKSQLENTVHLLGYQENPYPYIRAAEVFVVSSRTEGMPYVVLEALILNKPIVSTDITGSRELLKDGELGLLVENSEEGLYEGLKKMITDKALRESFTQKKKDFSAFEPKSVAREVEKIIDNL